MLKRSLFFLQFLWHSWWYISISHFQQSLNICVITVNLLCVLPLWHFCSAAVHLADCPAMSFVFVCWHILLSTSTFDILSDGNEWTHAWWGPIWNNKLASCRGKYVDSVFRVCSSLNRVPTSHHCEWLCFVLTFAQRDRRRTGRYVINLVIACHFKVLQMAATIREKTLKRKNKNVTPF